MQIMALVMARAGSVGLPGKNVADVAGKPLVQYPLEAAHRAESIGTVILNSDLPNAPEIAEETGSIWLPRLPTLTGDTAQMIDVIHRTVEWLKCNVCEPDILVTMHGNCAIHPDGLIDHCVNTLITHPSIDSCVSARVVQDLHPYRQKRVRGDGLLEPWVDIPGDVANNRQQVAEQSVILDGACRALRVDRCLNRDGQPPFRYLGERIAWVENPEGLDVHNTHDLAITTDWVRRNLPPANTNEMALRGYA